MSSKTAIRVVSQKANESAPNTVEDTERHTKVALAMSHFLASTYALYQKSLFYHWNVTGPHFAERVRALSHFAPVTHDMMTRRMEFHDKAAWMLRSLQG